MLKKKKAKQILLTVVIWIKSMELKNDPLDVIKLPISPQGKFKTIS